MGVMRIMAPLDGDKHIEWDPSDEKSVAKARKKFEELLGKGFQAFKVSRKPQRTGQQVKTFNPDIGEYILAPAMQGG